MAVPNILEGVIGDVIFGEPGKHLENSPMMGRKIGEPLSKWLSHFTELFLAQRGKLSNR